MKKITAAIMITTVLSACSVLLGGCSVFAPKTQYVGVTCSEPDAILQVNGQTYKGSGQASVRRDEPVAIACLKVGYYPAQKTIHTSLSGTGIADIVGTPIFLLPAIGLFTAGAYKLDETNVALRMIKQEISLVSSSRNGHD